MNLTSSLLLLAWQLAAIEQPIPIFEADIPGQSLGLASNGIGKVIAFTKSGRLLHVSYGAGIESIESAPKPGTAIYAGCFLGGGPATIGGEPVVRSFVTTEDGGLYSVQFMGKNAGLVGKIETKSRAFSMTADPVYNRIAVGQADGAVGLWDLSGGKLKPITNNVRHKAAVLAVAFDRCGDVLATAGEGGMLKLQLLNNEGSTVGTGFAKTGKKQINRLHFLNDRKESLLFACSDGTVGIVRNPRAGVNKSAGEEMTWETDILEGESGVYSLASHDRSVAVGFLDGSVRVYEVDESGAFSLSREWQPHKGAVTGIAFSGDGADLLTSGADNKFRVWIVNSLPTAKQHEAKQW